MKLSGMILTAGASLLVAARGAGSADTPPIAAVPAPTPTPTPAPATTATTLGITTAGVIVQAGDSIGVG